MLADVIPDRTEDRIPAALRKIRSAGKKLYRALTQLSGRVAAQVVGLAPEELLLWVYLTGVSHGAEVERRRHVDPQGTPPAAAPLGTDEQTPTFPDEGELVRPGRGRQISRDAE